MNTSNLRAHAESRVRLRDQKTFTEMSAEAIARMVFELETHQIELEMQNESLRLAQQELAENRDRYADLYNNAPVGYVSTDKEGLILQSNLTFTRMLGVSETSLGGQPLAAFICNEYLDEYDRVRRRAFSSGDKENAELRFRTHTGEFLWVGLDCTFAGSTGGECRFMLSDISAKKQLETGVRRIKTLKSIRSLAEGVALELNHIMVILLGNISKTRMKLAEGHPALKFLESAETSINRAESLSYQLQLFAREGEPQRERLDLAELVQDSLHFHLKDSGLVVVFECPDDLWAANAEKQLVQKVFTHLTRNARQAMPEGGHLFAELSNAPVSENMVAGLCKGQYIKATLRDEGAGMEQNVVDEIFNPFFSTVQNGRGLGLPTVYSIINNHGGHIGVESTLGKGTMVTLYLPAA